MVATEIRLDLNGKKGPDLWARLGESDTRQIVMHPGYFDPEGNWTPLIIDAENIFAKFRIVKPDNTFVIIDASLYLPSDPSIFVVTLPETATQVAGLGYYDLRIGDGETPDTFLYSAGGRFIVDDDMITDEMINSVASVNGLIFPDDFLTAADLDDYVKEEELDDYATKTYVDDAVASIETIHVYSTTEKIVGKWVDNKDIYEKSYIVTGLSGSVSDWEDFDTFSIDTFIRGYGVFDKSNGEHETIGNVFRLCYNPAIHPGSFCYYYSANNVTGFHITIEYTKP